ncbi:MAG: GNAT family N-acetyltransferase [Hyphomicrobiales bacterium]|nr:GNAT family N-acetyltransferase [Hyphomicrobiales bacterium]
MREGRLEFDTPRADWLSSYAQALEKGWSPDNTRDVSAEQLAALAHDPSAFLASLVAQGGTITLPDGSTRPKLPFIRLWLWDGEFCGTIALRWQKGTNALPAHVLGHIGYAIVPWKRGYGYASEALRVILERARDVGLTRVEITTDPANEASRRVIEKNGGRLVEEFVNEAYGTGVRLRYAVELRGAQ